MNREIKFRAWNDRDSDQRKWMMYNVFLSGDGQVIMPDGEFWDIPVMQFTGLKDSKGVEIYEGDILQVSQAVPQAGLFEVVWREGGFKYLWHIQNTVKEEALTQNPEFLVIIGNLYENPELIPK